MVRSPSLRSDLGMLEPVNTTNLAAPGFKTVPLKGAHITQASCDAPIPGTDSNIWMRKDRVPFGLFDPKGWRISVVFHCSRPSDDGSLVRGHIATVAWTGSVDQCVKSYLAFCKSVGQEVCLDLWPRPKEYEARRDRFVVTRSEVRLGRAVETLSELRTNAYGCRGMRTGVSCSPPTPAAIEVVIS